LKTKKIISVYLSAFLVGIALVLFPAAGNLFIDASYHGFSSVQYGSIFIPQIILAIISSLSAAKIASKFSMKGVMLFGLWSLLVAMSLLALSNQFMASNLDYTLIMLATGFLGTGFGLTITALNPFAYNLFPGKETSAVTAMHILLGLGTASAALFLNMFLKLGIWWGAPIAIAALIGAMILFSLRLNLKLPEEREKPTSTKKINKKIPRRIFGFALVVFLYGACEATFGNFGAVFLEKEGGLSVAKAAVGLSLFWGGITIGRVLFTIAAFKYETNRLYIIAPFVLSLVFYLLPSADNEFVLLGCMGLGGLASSFLFPKSISTATDEYPKYAVLVSGVMVASIQLGTGFSSNVIGILNKQFSLSSLFQYSALYALLLGILITTLLFTKIKNKPLS
jgi:fucose permease